MTNPLIYADVPDPDVIRVGDTYYMTSTTMHLAPGVPIMKSKDLVNWELVSYVYDIMDDGDAMSLKNGKNAYGQGSWASSLRYHYGRYYVVFASYTTNDTYVYTTHDLEHGPWKHTRLGGMYHDMSLFFDDDGKIYLVYGGKVIRVVEMETAPDGLRVKEGTEAVLIDDVWKGTPHSGDDSFLYAEGTHLQKINGKYYAFIISWPPANEETGMKGIRTELCVRADSIQDFIDGNWERKVILCDQGAAQGGIVDTPDGDWYGMVFRDMGPVGRCPVLVPVRWEDGWPMMGNKDGKVEEITTLPTQHQNEKGLVVSDDFTEQKLKIQWQWNHNPDNAAWSLTQRAGWLRMTAGSVCTSLTDAKNILSQRTYGPQCTASTALDLSGMKNGDVAGLSAFAAKYGYVGVKMEADEKYVVMVTTRETAPDVFEPYETVRIKLNRNRICLKIEFDYAHGDKAYFYYMDQMGNWIRIGEELSMVYSLAHFMGYRIGLFNYATVEEGGYVDFEYMKIEDEITEEKNGVAKKIGNSNPLVDHKYGADPYALTYDGRVYIYMTSDAYEYDEEGEVKDNSYGKITTLSVISSADMVNWTDHGVVHVAGRQDPDGDAKWANCSWAPAAAHKTINGREKFFLYFADGGGGIGVLEADSPVGPFTDPIKKALVAPGSEEAKDVVWLFDPAVLVDDDGCGYLYYGGGIPNDQDDASCNNPRTARVIKLGDDMVSTVGKAQMIDAPCLFEDSGIHKYKDKYYYSYCSNFAGKHKEGYPGYGNICYMVSDDPMGPFTPETYQGEILLNPEVYFQVGGNNHHAIFEFEGSYYITYHAQTLGKALGIEKGYRSTHINRVTIGPDGKIAPITADYAGISQLKELDPYAVNDARTRAWQWDYDPDAIHSGCWSVVAGAAFHENGAEKLRVEAIPLAGGTITVRLDDMNGPAVATVRVSGDEDDVVRTYTVALTERLTGTHDLYFIFDSYRETEEVLMQLKKWYFL